MLQWILTPSGVPNVWGEKYETLMQNKMEKSLLFEH